MKPPTAVLLLLLSFGCASEKRTLVTANLDEPWLDPDRPTLRVGPRVLTQGEIYRRVLKRLGTKQILLGIAGEELFRIEAEERGIVISDEDARAQGAQKYRAWVESLGGDRAAAEELAQAGLTDAEMADVFVEEARHDLLVARVVALFRPQDDTALRRYYEQTYAQNRALVRRLGFPGSAGIEKAAAEGLAQAAGRRLRAGEAWDAVAKEYLGAGEGGKKPPSAIGGDEWWIGDQDDVPAELKKTIFSLETGQVSEPVWEAEFGYHVFTVVAKIPSEPFAACLERMRQEIRTRAPDDAETRAVLAELQNRYPVAVIAQEGKAEAPGPSAPPPDGSSPR